MDLCNQSCCLAYVLFTVCHAAGGAKPAQSAFPAGKVAEAALFHDYAKLTTAGGDIPSVDVRVIQDTASKQVGSSAACREPVL